MSQQWKGRTSLKQAGHVDLADGAEFTQVNAPTQRNLDKPSQNRTELSEEDRVSTVVRPSATPYSHVHIHDEGTQSR